MIKRFCVFFVILLSSVFVSAQIPAGFVQVTATVPVLANGSFSANWTNLASQSQLPLLGGVSSFQQIIVGNFDSNGHISTLLADPSQILPNPSEWIFSINFPCPNLPSGGYSVSIASPITGAGGTSQDISSQLISSFPGNACNGSTGFVNSSIISINPLLHTPSIQPFASNYLSHFYWRDQWTNLNNSQSGITNSMFNISHYNYNGGYNFNENGYTNKTFWPVMDVYRYAYTPGENFGLSSSVNCYAVGDCIALSGNILDFGGSANGSDEGAEVFRLNTQQGNIAYQGTCNTGCFSGSTSLTVNPIQGSNTQGSGRFLIDLTKGFGSGTITTIAGSGPVTYTGSGTGWSVSTSTVLTAPITVPGGQTSPGSVNASVSSSAGMDTSTLVCVADTGAFEMVTPSVVPDGTHFTATFRKAHLNGAIVSFGGLCGDYISLTADTWTTAIGTPSVTPPLRQIWPVVASTSSTTIQVWINYAGLYNGYTGQAITSAGNNTYTLYPGAEVISVAAGLLGTSLGNTFSLAPNNTSWTASDSLELPLYPAFHISQQNYLYKYFTSPANGASSNGYTYNGLWAAGDEGFRLVNNTSTGVYTTTYRPPQYAFHAAGAWDRGLGVDYAPSNGAIVVGCPYTGCATNSDIPMLLTNGGDFLSYNYSNGSWRLFAANHTAQLLFSSGGLSIPSIAINGGTSLTTSNQSGTGNLVLQSNPALLGIPTAPTASPGTSTTQLSTTAFVQSAVSALAFPVYNETAAIKSNAHIVVGGAALSAGTFTATFTGASIFSTSGTYGCTANDSITANAVQVTITSGSSVTFNGTGSDNIRFLCIGN